MTYQEQQEKEPYINPPKSPIPPLTQHRIAYSRMCRYCNQVQLLIKRERITDSPTSQKRYIRVPRDLQGNIHVCRTNFNDTKKEHE